MRPKRINKFIKIRQNIEYESSSEILWSTKFSVDNIDDFLISMKAPAEESKHEIDGENFTMWYVPSSSNQFTRYVRVIITTKDNASLFILLSDPSHPDIMINNLSNEIIHYKQKGSQDYKSLMPNSSIPFVSEDQSSDKKEITMRTDEKSKDYKLDEIAQLDQLKTNDGKKLDVELKVQNDYKELVISNPEESKNFEIGDKGNIFKLILMNKIILKCFLITIDIKDICISMIDSDPKEVLLLSIRSLSLKFGKKVSYHSLEIDENLDLIVDHVQIDNMSTLENPVIF